MAKSQERELESPRAFFNDLERRLGVVDKLQFRVCLGMIATGFFSVLALLSLSDARVGVYNRIQMLSDAWLDGLSQHQREEWIWAERKEVDRIFPETLIAEQLSRRYRKARLDYIRQEGDDPHAQGDFLSWLMVPPTGGSLSGMAGLFFLPGSFRRIF